MIRKVYFDNLPKWESGGNKGRINWNKSIGYKIEFVYDDINGYIEILDYHKQKQSVLLKYKNNTQYMKTGHLQKYAIGNLLGLINHEYVYSKGDIIKVTTGEIMILDQITMRVAKNYNIRGYKYKCLNDGYISNVSESNLKNENGCPVCSNRIIIKGVNDLSSTHPHLLKYFVSIEDAYSNSYGSKKEVLMRCPNCKHDKNQNINKLVNRGFSCRKCGDGISYPEKFIYNFLDQLNVAFEIQKVFHWSDDKQFDFYIPSLNCIIETHGLQHYKNNYSFSPNIKLKDIQENDNYKYKLALENNVSKYIVLDCREWENDWIKNEIEKSDLAKTFNLSKINWLSCHMFACSSRVKEACDLWNNYSANTKMISQKMKLSRQTVIKYLKQGSKIGWCIYDAKKNMIENGRRNGLMIHGKNY